MIEKRDLINKYLQQNAKPLDRGFVVKQHPETGVEFIHSWNVPGLAKPSDATLNPLGDLVVVDRHKDAIRKQIRDLEAAQTPRRLREAVIYQDGKAWLEDLESQLISLRSQL